MNKKKTADDYTRDMLNIIRGAEYHNNENNYGVILEEKENTKSAIAITDDPRFGQNVLSNQISQFRSMVEGGAQFSNANTEDPSSSPLIYLPEENNLVFSGIIPSLNNLKFQMKLKNTTGTGLFIWCDGTILSRENMQILTKLQGYYLNWKAQWESQQGELEQITKLFQP